MEILTDNAIRCTVQHLFIIAGVKQNIENIKVYRNEDNCRIIVEISEKKEIFFKLMSKIEIVKLLKGELLLKRVASFDGKVTVPLFFTTDSDDFALINDGKLIINADIIILSFIMLSRYEETLTTERDLNNRFEYKNSLACKYNFIDIPIVDEYAMLLRMWLLKFIPTLPIRKRKSNVIPTHDIDEILRFGNIFRNTKTIIGGDIISRKSLLIAYKSLNQCFATFYNSKKDPLVIAIERLIEVSRISGLCSEFYFKGLEKGENDATYDIFMSEVKYCMDKIIDAGMIVGMHGGYDSYNNEIIFQHEKENIEAVYGETVKSGRQHFLRFDINKTINVWQNCGVKNDSTLGYNEREGFRCGTCHEYYLYDLKNDCISTVQEHPLIVMEKTLFTYRKQNIVTALANIEKLYARCKAVEGDFVILWHNEMVFREYEIRFRDVYCKFIESIFR